MFAVLTRQQAANLGQKRYYTGRPCSKGHSAQRFTSTGGCVVCSKNYVKEYQSRLKKTTVANLAGFFSYPLHPDDHAAALAYCQALDLARGRAPHVPAAAVVAAPFVLPADIARHRAVLLEAHAPKTEVLDYPIK